MKCGEEMCLVELHARRAAVNLLQDLHGKNPLSKQKNQGRHGVISRQPWPRPARRFRFRNVTANNEATMKVCHKTKHSRDLNERMCICCLEVRSRCDAIFLQNITISTFWRCEETFDCGRRRTRHSHTRSGHASVSLRSLQCQLTRDGKFLLGH